MDKNLRQIKLSKIIFIILSIACMIIIFIFSMENSDESSDTSGRITEITVKTFIPDYDNLSSVRQSEITASADHIIRKAAHFTIYGILGFLLSCAVGKRYFFSSGTFAVTLISFVYACTDELHQYFVPGRSCQFTDVLIDTLGSICGIIISLICIHFVLFIRKTKAPLKGRQL